jgi:ubiquinone/menaquinone biosynthesis C-methylase UbiE
MQEKLRNYISRQFGNPSGLLGRFIGNGMARRNAHDAEWTISLLNIQPHQRLLEIGFGPGVSTQMASEKATEGFVAGLDHSKDMVQAASQRNAIAIQSGRVELRQGEVSSLPYSDGSFDIVYSIHSIYFWRNPVDCLKEIKRVLKPGGLLAITIQPKDKWRPNVDPRVMTLYFGNELASLLPEAGFRDVRVEVKVTPGQHQRYLECILATA